MYITISTYIHIFPALSKISCNNNVLDGVFLANGKAQLNVLYTIFRFGKKCVVVAVVGEADVTKF